MSLQKHIWAIFNTFLAALYIYLQLLQWKKHGDDFMMVAVNIVVTAALWLSLMGAIGRYWRDGRQANALRLQLTEAEAQHRKALAELTTDLTAKLDRDHEKSMEQERTKAKQRTDEMYRYFAEEVRRAERLNFLSADIGSLWLLLEHMVGTATTSGAVPPEVLCYPLSDRIYKLEFTNFTGLRIDIWKFQKDFEFQRNRLRALSNLVPNLKAAFVKPTMTLPSERTADEVIELLRNCAEELNQESAKIWLKMESA